MALSLGMTIGSRVLVGKDMLEVLDVRNAVEVILKARDKLFSITDQERQEVLPNVFVSCGVSQASPNNHSSRLAIEAPLSLNIARVKT